MIPDKVRNQLDCLESRLHFRLTDIPVGARDQWTACLRDEMTSLGVDINDPVQARAAFAGAHGVAGLLLPTCRTRVPAVSTMALLRWLLDQADTQPLLDPPTDR